MNTEDILERINELCDGLTANVETEATDVTPEHIGLIRITLDSSVPEFHEVIKHDAVADIIELELAKLGILDELIFVDADEAANVAWYEVL